jgi:predicted RNA-binding Zn-ribbon protein involved in translation (DUF1610 family)
MKRETRICDECESDYYKDSSEMISLCPDCSNKLYGYPNCQHQFDDGKCTNCGWNGISSDYLKNRKK